MTTTVTIIDNTYDSNIGSGRKQIFATVSCTNPYTAGGEAITVSSWFPNKFLGAGGAVYNPSVAITSIFPAIIRADTSSVSTVKLQFLNAGLTATANAGLFVDNTVANISNVTVYTQLWGY